MIKNRQINAILLTILWFTKDGNGNEIQGGGLLTESCGLGLKRKLQKIRLELLKKQEDFIKDSADVDKLKEGLIKPAEGEKLTEEEENKNAELIASITKEMNELLDEEFELAADMASISEIEKINTSVLYDFEMIELIAK